MNIDTIRKYLSSSKPSELAESSPEVKNQRRVFFRCGNKDRELEIVHFISG